MTDSAVEPDGRKPRRRRPWLVGGSSTQHWNGEMVGWAFLALGAGVVGSELLKRVFPGALGAGAGVVVLWTAMAVPVAMAFRRSVPRRLLTFRWVDLLFGVTFGIALRLTNGWLESVASGTRHWPSYDTGNSGWWFNDLIAPAVVAPVVEELFFHGFLLVALYTVLRRSTRSHLSAGLAAAFITTAVFVLAHLLTGSLVADWTGPVSIAGVGLAGAALVLITGRLWGALVTHVVFNASYAVLALAGSWLGTAGPTVGLA